MCTRVKKCVCVCVRVRKQDTPAEGVPDAYIIKLFATHLYLLYLAIVANRLSRRYRLNY